MPLLTSGAVVRYAPVVGTVVIVGAGDLGERVAAGLAAGGRVRRVVLVGRSGATAVAAAMVASAADCLAEAVTLRAAAAIRTIRRAAADHAPCGRRDHRAGGVPCP